MNNLKKLSLCSHNYILCMFTSKYSVPLCLANLRPTFLLFYIKKAENKTKKDTQNSLINLDQVSTNSIHFNPIWSILIQFEPIWSILNHINPFWSIMIQFDPIWSCLNKFDPFWTIWIKFKPYWSIKKQNFWFSE